MDQRLPRRNAPVCVECVGVHMTGARVLFATSEVAPLIKTGGLADVSAALPKALAGLGCDVRILVPAYTDLLADLDDLVPVHVCRLGDQVVEIVEARHNGLPPLWLVRNACFDRAGNPYLGPDGRDWPDNAERFTLLARAAAELAQRATGGFRPDVLHLNDWQTALAAALLADAPARPGVLFTIHNLNFQGLFDQDCFRRLALPARLAGMEGLEFHGRLSMIKGGLVFADAITTVSPTYAREICTPELGAGLDGLLRHRSARLHGILNGIDTALWNPATDPYTHTRYDAGTLEHKRANTDALRARLSLPAGRGPLLGMVSRLTEQKGIDLVLEALPMMVAEGLQLAVLGSGAAHFERALEEAAVRFPGRIAYRSGYDEPLAHLIEAGADLFLMPSRFEPCGLNQMYSMAYGTLPLVHRTGGLADTVRPAGRPGQLPDTGTGFVMAEATPDALLTTLRNARELWRRPEHWRTLQHNGMHADFSWATSARRYLALYREVCRS